MFRVTPPPHPPTPSATMTEGVPWNAFSEQDGTPVQPVVLEWHAWDGGKPLSAAKSKQKDGGENSWAVFEERDEPCGECKRDETGGGESEWQDFAQERSFGAPIKTVAESSSSKEALTSSCPLQPLAPPCSFPSASTAPVNPSSGVFRSCFQCSLVPLGDAPERQPIVCLFDSR